MMKQSLLDYYKAIENASGKMLEAAKGEDWDGVMELESTCAILIAQLRSRSRISQLAPDERQEKTQIMKRILRTDAEIRNLAEPWLADLAFITDPTPSALH